MPYQLLADTILLLHLAFIFFVLFGAFLLIPYPRLIYLHLPAALWGVIIEVTGGVCPLTPLENHFRSLAGQGVYVGDFIARYLVPLVYPAGLTRAHQYLLAAGCLLINSLLYLWLFTCHRNKGKK